MGQQPNIELEISDLPRPTPRPAPARRWSPGRPGDLTVPQDVPSGGAFGSTGPDPGYALRLVRTVDLALGPAEQAHNAEAAVAAIAGARAVHFSRAPIIEDVEVAALVLGYDTEGVPADLVDDLVADRPALVANIGHSSRQSTALIALVAPDVLSAGADEVRARMAAGERLLRR